MSLSTLDRWIAAGRVQIRKEPVGRRHRVYVMSEDWPDGAKRELVDRLPDAVSLAVDQERIGHLEEMIELLKEQLQVERERYNSLLNVLRPNRLHESGAGRQRAWWRFWKRWS